MRVMLRYVFQSICKPANMLPDAFLIIIIYFSFPPGSFSAISIQSPPPRNDCPAYESKASPPPSQMVVVFVVVVFGKGFRYESSKNPVPAGNIRWEMLKRASVDDEARLCRSLLKDGKD